MNNITCQTCKYHDWDWDWCGDDEYAFEVCRKHKREIEDINDTCNDYKKYKPKPYVEKDTVCDKCKYLKDCIGELMKITTILDSRSHYISGRGYTCKAERK